jgi:hypothetical protein
MSADNGGAWVQVEGVPGSVSDVLATDSQIFVATSSGLYRIDRASGLFETAALFPLIAANNAAWLAVPQRRSGDQPAYRLRRLTTGVIGRLRQKLTAAGIDALRTLEMQQVPEAPRVADLQPSARVLDPAAIDRLSFADDAPYALYFREIFFHIPYLFGRVLQQHQRFAESRRWYAYIFDPQVSGEAGPDRFWRYLPFRSHRRHTLAQALSAAQLQVAEADPFDPFAIADIRPEAYQKAIAMQAIDNLLAWADALYAQDCWENLNAATTLYVLVAELLGPPAPPSPQAGEAADPPQLLAAGKQAHQLHPDLRNLLPAADGQSDMPGLSIPSFFFLPENDQFAGYWQLVNRRLDQIRHCLNLQGVARQLAIYGAPIDPRQLIRAVAAGRMLDSVAAAEATATLSSDIPHYRFSYMLGRAREIVSELRQLGGALLSALEKHDAERLAVLRNTYEGALLNLTTRIKQKQQEEAAHSLDSLQRNLDLAQARYERYQSWADEYLSPGEQSGLAQTQGAALLKHVGSLITGLSAIGYAIPNIYGLADGGMNFGKVIEVGADTLAVEASIMEWAGQMALTKAQYDRRKADWQLQADQARVEAQQIAAQIRAQQARQDMADQELLIHQQSISQNQDLDQYYARTVPLQAERTALRPRLPRPLPA